MIITKPVPGDDEKMEVDEPKKMSPIILSAQVSTDEVSITVEGKDAQVPAPAPVSLEYPLSFKYALQLTFAMLSYVLKHPIRNPHRAHPRQTRI